MSLPLPARAWPVAIVAMLAGCASIDPGGEPGPAAAAPTYQVGDRWVYHVAQGFRAPITWNETHEVVAIGGDGITVRVTLEGEHIDLVRTERLAAPGVVREGAIFEAETDRFQPPLMRYKFPLVFGERWFERMRDLNKPATLYGDIERQTTVGGYERVDSPGGPVEAIRLRVFQRLDDETVWRYATECSYLLWYAPSIGATVREQKDCQYQEKGGGFDSAVNFPAQRARVQLVSFKRAG